MCWLTAKVILICNENINFPSRSPYVIVSCALKLIGEVILLPNGKNSTFVFRLRKEIDTVIGQSEEITAKDIMSMQYLTQVVKESLRLHPPTPAITRRTDKDTLIGSVIIPDDTPIMVNPYVIQTHPDYWEDPHDFKPERFASVENLHPYAYFPFSLGPRRCIAPQLADLQVKLVIARLLKKFKFKLLPGQTLKLAENISFGPVGTVRCTLAFADQH